MFGVSCGSRSDKNGAAGASSGCWRRSIAHSMTKGVLLRTNSLRIFGQTAALTSRQMSLTEERYLRMRDWSMPPRMESGIWCSTMALLTDGTRLFAFGTFDDQLVVRNLSRFGLRAGRPQDSRQDAGATTRA